MEVAYDYINTSWNFPAKSNSRSSSSLCNSTVLQVDIESLAHPINANSDQSFKQEGAAFIGVLTSGTGRDIYIAAGDQPGSAWAKVSTGLEIPPS